MKNRIFLAINLPQTVKEQLVFEQRKIDDLFNFGNQELSSGLIKWVTQENLHLTLAFIGQTNQDQLKNIFQVVEKVSSSHKPFRMELFKIIYGPPGNYDFESKKIPRMIWVKIKPVKNLLFLQEELEKYLFDFKINSSFSLDEKNRALLKDGNFSPHITLGRIRQWQWKRIEPEERPRMEIDISLNCLVDSIDIMNSQLKIRGSQYTILQTYKL